MFSASKLKMPFLYRFKIMLAALGAFLYAFAGFAQANLSANVLCKDSNAITRYHSSEGFERSRIIPVADGGTISWGGIDDGYSSFNCISIFRTNAAGNVLWSTKLLPEANLNFPEVEITELNNGDFVVTGTAKFGHDNYSQYFFIASVSNIGKLLWFHFYELKLTGNNNSGSPSTSKPAIDAQDNIYISIVFGGVLASNDRGPSVISKFSSNGSLIWNKAFITLGGNLLLPGVANDSYRIFASNDTLTMFSSTGFYLIMQLKSSNAALLRVKAFNPVNYTLFSDLPVGDHVERTNNNNYVFNGEQRNGDGAGIDFSTVVFNQNLDPIKSFQLKTFPAGYPNGLGLVIKNFTVTPNGEIIYGIARDIEKSLYYALLDTNYKFTTQKKIQYAGLNNSNFNLPPLTGYKNNKVSVRMNGCSARGVACDIDYLSFDKSVTSISNCFSVVDTSFMQLLPFDMVPVSTNEAFTEDNVLQEVALSLTQQNTSFTSEEVCKEISICETPVIHGKDSICLGSNQNIFTVHTGTQCLKKVKWQTDISAASAFKMIDDTTVSITFKKNWRGYVYATLSGGCGEMSDSFFVTTYKNISRKILGNDTSICAGDTAFIRAEAGFVSYKWNTGETTLTAAVTAKGQYSVQAFNNDGCYVADTLQILAVFAKPEIVFGVSDFVCKGSNEILDAGSGFINYLWQNGSTERYFTVTQPGHYWVQAKDSNGCLAGDTAVINKLYNAPIDFLFSDTAICPYEALEIKPAATYLSYLWSNGTVAPSLIINKAGTYWLKVTDSNGCVGTDSTLVTEKLCINRMIFSNAFSPDYNGNNDSFKPFVTGGLVKYKLSIFNRWGTKVFESDNPAKGWDGSCKAKMQGANAFVWICNYQFAGEPPKTQRGSLLLIR